MRAVRWVGLLASILVSAHLSGGTALPPQPNGAPGQAVTPAEARALADWALAQHDVAARVKDHRTRLLRAGLAEASKESSKETKVGPKAVLFFRDYDAGVVRRVTVDLQTGAVEIRDAAGLVQPSREEIAEGMAIVLRDPGLDSLAADPALTLMGGFHVKSPYPDDPCSRDVCLEFAFMKPGANPNPGAAKKPPRGVIVNLSRRAVVNRDYASDLRPNALSPRMSVIPESP